MQVDGRRLELVSGVAHCRLLLKYPCKGEAHSTSRSSTPIAAYLSSHWSAAAATINYAAAQKDEELIHNIQAGKRLIRWAHT